MRPFVRVKFSWKDLLCDGLKLGQYWNLEVLTLFFGCGSPSATSVNNLSYNLFSNVSFDDQKALFKSFCDTVKCLCNGGVVGKGDAQSDLESHRIKAA